MRTIDQLQLTNSFAALGEAFHTPVRPTPLADPRLVSLSHAAAALIDLDPREAERPELVRRLSGLELPPGARPVAALYAGHQFGHYVPQLGDGRAILLGEVTNERGERWELQLKGAGLTPYSRDGDGRAVLRSTIREYLCSEAMHALGIPTTRALCLFASDEEVYRKRIEPGAILVRMAPSHVRFGSFEVFFYRGHHDRLETLASYLIAHHFPALAEAPEPHLALLEEVIRLTAELIARWQLVGFAHGVMNTDNMSMLGLTLDYGPYGFMDAFDPGFVCNHSDRWGRYAFDRQPAIGLWNLTCLAQAMLPLLDPENGEAAAEKAQAALAGYQPSFDRAYAAGMCAKLGLREERAGDMDLVLDLLRRMATNRVDYTNLFRALGRVRSDGPEGDQAARDLFIDRAAFDQWAGQYRQRLRAEQSKDPIRQRGMDRVNPRYVLRNYLAQQAIERAEQGDYGEVDRLLAVLSRPFDEQEGRAHYAAEPPEWGRALAVSCSS
ncbi:MAG: YdiU family protein [Chromatiaceae bacterium]|jgi:hypothetical protein|nr:YdiU family protein [Chromatiaceae bacterium]